MNKHELVVTEMAILEQIKLADLEIGDMIPSVRKLQSEIYSSRNGVLAALKSLSEKGIIEKGASPRQGYTLCQNVNGIPASFNNNLPTTIQYLLPFSTWNYTINKFLSSFEDAFSKQQIDLVFSNTHNSVEAETRLIGSIMTKSSRPDFLFLTTCNSFSNPNIPLLEEINKEIPVILIDRYFPNHCFHYIGVDNTMIGNKTARYLLDNGHTSIAYIKAYNNISTIRDRFTGFKQTLEEASISLPDCNIYTLPDSNVGSLSEIQSKINDIGQQILSAPTQPTVVVCSFDRIAVALIHFFTKNNIRVPEDICVIACDNDTDIAATSPVSLTTFRHPYKECAFEAINRIHRIRNRMYLAPYSVEFYSEMLLGKSTEKNIL